RQPASPRSVGQRPPVTARWSRVTRSRSPVTVAGPSNAALQIAASLLGRNLRQHLERSSDAEQRVANLRPLGVEGLHLAAPLLELCLKNLDPLENGAIHVRHSLSPSRLR